ncbi:THUMP domain-containing protein 1 [Patella vulgata]|uniref:THUMP domain-containing protein 1 n=1 Tax=Patella vulgata TaxID=6465 RepID=UPI0024A9AF2F|nr:THUMP domain-containing protein 1 [Patella vulgata]XP_050410083.2 THUMP domain-containing protein 1 [Patella vulgata]XP_050410084.2 THUMP domain-containing protein 1 [Patella vulgata]XP_050410085.2 THUMP domain-containing protein 1 [Patella vulgata]
MSSEGKKHGKKRPKSYYKKCANVKRKRLNILEGGLKGFIITCCDREKEATREAYSILNDYADKLYGPENFKTDAPNNGGEEKEDEDEDIEKAMTKEVGAIKETKSTERRFQRLESKTKNCIFIKTTLESPTELAEKLFQNLYDTKTQRSRYVMRLFPVEGTCKAVLDEIKKLGGNLFQKYFSTPYGEGMSFSIIFKARNNNNIGRDSIIPELSHLVTELNPAHTVEYDNPDCLIFVQVLCTICCISILKNFTKFKKYNLQEIAKNEQNCPSNEMQASDLKAETENLSKDQMQTDSVDVPDNIITTTNDNQTTNDNEITNDNETTNDKLKCSDTSEKQTNITENKEEVKETSMEKSDVNAIE